MTWLRTLWPSGFWSALGYLVLPIAGLWQGTGFSNPFQRWRARQRLTLYQPSGIEPLRHHPVLWIHAAALGEWLALRPLLQRIKADHPKLRIFATASAREVHSTIARFGEIDVVGCLPLDCSALCRRALGVIRPACIMLAETEIWPNFIATAAARGIPLALVNARLDDCAFRHYQLLRPLFAPILEHYQTVVAQSARDHARFQALGVAATSLHISGNLKRDAALRRADTASATRWRAALGLRDQDLLLIAASIHPREERLIATVFRTCQSTHVGLRLLLAPRHASRSAAVMRRLKTLGIAATAFSQLTPQAGAQPPVIVLDHTGELAELYSAADLVFIGGSLHAWGGHNPYEPAAWGKAILFGSHMENFRDIAERLVEYGGALQIHNGAELIAVCKAVLGDEERRSAMGRSARRAVVDQPNALERTYAALQPLLAEAYPQQ